MLGPMPRVSWPQFLVRGCGFPARALVGLPLMAALAFSACSKTIRGEFSAESCSNTVDDDGDGYMNCDDPDCWVYCPMIINEPRDASFPPEVDAQVADSGQPPRDPNRPAPMQPEDDGGSVAPDPEDDAGVPAGCGCTDDEVCVDDTCLPRPRIQGDYLLRITSAFVPSYSTTDRCYDYANPSCMMRYPVICDCLRPDPYVFVTLDSVPLDRTMTARSTTMPSWTPPASPTVRVTLTPDSVLTFIAFDDGGAGNDTEMFRCSPDLSPLESGGDSLVCSPDPKTTIEPPRSASFYITARIENVPPQ
jgi:hypothetical protein